MSHEEIPSNWFKFIYSFLSQFSLFFKLKIQICLKRMNVNRYLTNLCSITCTSDFLWIAIFSLSQFQLKLKSDDLFCRFSTCNSFECSNRTDWNGAVLLIRLVKLWSVFKNSRSWPSLSLAITVLSKCLHLTWISSFPLALDIASIHDIVTHPNRTKPPL